MMDNSEILNKMLKGAETAARTASALKKQLDDTIPALQNELKAKGVDTSKIELMQKYAKIAAKTGDINVILKAKEEILKK